MSFIVFYTTIVVVFIIIVFVLGLFTHVSPTLLLIMMFVFLLFVFIMTAGYAADAAGKTGGKDADKANKSAHNRYVQASLISWIIIGFAVLAIIGFIVISVMGGGEAAAGSALLGEGAAAAGAAETAAVSEAMSATSEAMELASKITKEKKLNKGLFDTGTGFSKYVHIALYIVLGITMILAFVVGLLLAIGAGVQGGSNSKKGLKKAAIGATMSLFVVGMYVVLFIVMWVKGRNLNKRLKEDIAKQEQITRTYLEQEKANVDQAKGRFVRDMLTHNFNLPQPLPA